MTIREALAALPDHWEVTVPAGELRALLDDGAEQAPELKETEPLTWMTTRDAALRLDESPRTMTDRARRWARMVEDGRGVPIRVRRAGDADQSPWLFCEQDVLRLEAAQGDEDPRNSATIQSWADKVA